MRRRNGISAILHPSPKIVKKFNTIEYSGGTILGMDEFELMGALASGKLKPPI
jgi:hypothetical protein